MGLYLFAGLLMQELENLLMTCSLPYHQLVNAVIYVQEHKCNGK